MKKNIRNRNKSTKHKEIPKQSSLTLIKLLTDSTGAGILPTDIMRYIFEFITEIELISNRCISKQFNELFRMDWRLTKPLANQIDIICERKVVDKVDEQRSLYGKKLESVLRELMLKFFLIIIAAYGVAGVFFSQRSFSDHSELFMADSFKMLSCPSKNANSFLENIFLLGLVVCVISLLAKSYVSFKRAKLVTRAYQQDIEALVESKDIFFHSREQDLRVFSPQTPSTPQEFSV